MHRCLAIPTTTIRTAITRLQKVISPLPACLKLLLLLFLLDDDDDDLLTVEQLKMSSRPAGLACRLLVSPETIQPKKAAEIKRGFIISNHDLTNKSTTATTKSFFFSQNSGSFSLFYPSFISLGKSAFQTIVHPESSQVIFSLSLSLLRRPLNLKLSDRPIVVQRLQHHIIAFKGNYVNVMNWQCLVGRWTKKKQVWW